MDGLVQGMGWERDGEVWPLAMKVERHGTGTKKSPSPPLRPNASTCYFCDLGQITKRPWNITTFTVHPTYGRTGV